MGKKGKGTSDGRRARDARGGLPDRDSEDNAMFIVKVIGAFMALGVALVFPYMLLGSGGSVRHIDLDSSPEFLKSVFFGGDPWLLVCTTKEKAPPALDKFITASDSLYSKGVTVATIRCGGELPSGKKVMDRFKLSPPIKKAAFLCANGKKCQQLPAVSMKTSDAIVKWVAPKVQMMLYEPNNAQQFGTACTNHKLCVVSVKDGPHAKAELEVLKKAAGKRRTVPFAVVDASAKSFSLRKKLPTTGGPHVVLLRGGGKKANVSAALIKEEFGVNTITESIDAAVTNVTDFSVLKKRPVLSTRRPKNKYKSKKQAQQQNAKQRSSGQGAQKRSNRKKKTSQGGGKPATAKTTETDKGEGLVSDEERERRRQMDDEIAGMFEPIEEGEVVEGYEPEEVDEDYYEVVEEGDEEGGETVEAADAEDDSSENEAQSIEAEADNGDEDDL
eukprot:m.458695 g.458695  ORF g.458695 m.458695 type:complete len:444 (+) comp21565_c0_seq1:212-1543(+)